MTIRVVTAPHIFKLNSYLKVAIFFPISLVHSNSTFIMLSFMLNLYQAQISNGSHSALKTHV